jgi:hypothetical protein
MPTNVMFYLQPMISLSHFLGLHEVSIFSLPYSLPSVFEDVVYAVFEKRF